MTTQHTWLQRSPPARRLYKSDRTVYSEVRTYDISSLEPMVAPLLPPNAVPVGQVTAAVDQGHRSCTTEGCGTACSSSSAERVSGRSIHTAHCDTCDSE